MKKTRKDWEFPARTPSNQFKRRWGRGQMVTGKQRTVPRVLGLRVTRRDCCKASPLSYALATDPEAVTCCFAQAARFDVLDDLKSTVEERKKERDRFPAARRGKRWLAPASSVFRPS